MQRPAIIRSQTVHEGWTKFLLAETRLPDGETVSRAVLDHGVAAAVLAYDRESRTALLVRQYRVPMLYVGSQEALLEAVAFLLRKKFLQNQMVVH